MRSILIVSFLVASSLAAHSQSTPQAEPQANTSTVSSSQVEIPAGTQWVDTKIDLRGGAQIRITGTGNITYSQGPSFGPDGLPRNWKDMLHQYAVPNGGHGALIGRLGSGEATQPFLVGASKEYQAPVGGHLFLGINQSQADASGAQGGFQAKIEVLKEGTGSTTGGPAETTISSITPQILNEIPRRVSDMQGNPGDMVNILIVGTQDQLIKTFTSAGWVQVDRSVQSTVLAGFLTSMQKKDYLTMPMSTLYLFKQPQDYGFAHAEPVRVAMSRNHLRVWKSPYTVDGEQLWCVAATHDIGFERDQRNNGVTHKIDPAIDGEREFVNETLSNTGLVAQRAHVTPSDPLTEAKTATGGSFHSDGKILVLVLAKAQ